MKAKTLTLKRLASAKSVSLYPDYQIVVTGKTTTAYLPSPENLQLLEQGWQPGEIRAYEWKDEQVKYIISFVRKPTVAS